MNYQLIKKIALITLTFSMYISATASDSCSLADNCTPAGTDICISCCPLSQQKGYIYNKTQFVTRSQQFNIPRYLMMPDTAFCPLGCISITTHFAFEYQQIFNTQNCENDGCQFSWFSPNANSVITYGLDNGTPGVGEFDINGLNFGLTSSGNFNFFPKKSDVIMDVIFVANLSTIIKGLWGRVDLPITHTRWDLLIDEVSTGESDPSYPVDSVGTGTIATVFNTMKEALGSVSGFGDAPALTKGKICGRRAQTGLADMRIDIGCTWYNTNRCCLGTTFDVIAPVGSKPCADFLFNAVLGASQWQFGGDVYGERLLWKSCDETNYVTLSFDATLNGMLNSKQNRLLQLFIDGKESPWSQYLLLKKFNAAGQAIGLERAANILGQGSINVGSTFMTDVAVFVEYTRKCFFVGIGYDFWYRGAEGITARYFDIPADTYAVKGGTQWNGDITDPHNNETASTSTIGHNGPVDPDGPVFISNEDINYCPALHPSALTNGLFGFLGYQWRNCCTQPYLLLGGQAEFGHCGRAFNQWGVLAKGGFSF